MMLRITLTFLLMGFLSTGFAQMKVGDTFPHWTAGYLDIHHISTGRGESTFAILPDGTTLLVDAGEVAPTAGVADARPNGSRPAGEWIGRYVRHMMQPLPGPQIDYLLVTHFHADHMGGLVLGNGIAVHTVVDRQWPDYNWPVPLRTETGLQPYFRFVEQHVASGGTAEAFRTGTNTQFTLRKQPRQYPAFDIRNVAANGQVWTGVGNGVRTHFPPLDSLPADAYPTENQCSAAIRLSYGKFDYFTGGDLVNAGAPGTWKDIETPVGQVVGPVEVCKANHHASYDAMGNAFLQAVRPRVVVVPLWSAGQLENHHLQRMLSPSVYPGERDIFATQLMDATRKVVGRRADQLKSEHGHVVIRVHPGGDRYEVFVLDDTTERYTINAIHGPYESR